MLIYIDAAFISANAQRCVCVCVHTALKTQILSHPLCLAAAPFFSSSSPLRSSSVLIRSMWLLALHGAGLQEQTVLARCVFRLQSFASACAAATSLSSPPWLVYCYRRNSRPSDRDIRPAPRGEGAVGGGGGSTAAPLDFWNR